MKAHQKYCGGSKLFIDEKNEVTPISAKTPPTATSSAPSARDQSGGWCGRDRAGVV
ncbi:MAG: hypothetical protein ABIP94_25850 [Planctomycetota bacterium]